MQLDYYKILEVGNDASDAEIKDAYRKKVKQYHPSLNNEPGAIDKFKEVNEAYEILIHRNTRELYEEDYKSWHNPEEYPVYRFWIEAAHARANEHAQMTFHDFIKTKFYKNTKTWNYSVFLMGLILGIVISVVPYVIMAMSENKFIGVAVLFLALPIGIFLIV